MCKPLEESGGQMSLLILPALQYKSFNLHIILAVYAFPYRDYPYAGQ